MKTKDLKLVLEKFLTSDAATNARVQVCLPNGEFYDISGMQLMENKLFGVTIERNTPISHSPLIFYGQE
jgi:hypothetical protein